MEWNWVNTSSEVLGSLSSFISLWWCCSPRSMSGHPPFSAKCDLEQVSFCQPRCYRYVISCQSMCTLAWHWFQYPKPLWLHQKCPITTTSTTNPNTITNIPFWERMCWLFSHQTHFISHHVDTFSRCICIYSYKANKVNSATLQNIFRDLFAYLPTLYLN